MKGFFSNLVVDNLRHTHQHFFRARYLVHDFDIGCQKVGLGNHFLVISFALGIDLAHEVEDRAWIARIEVISCHRFQRCTVD